MKQKIKNNKLINETAKSLKKGPVIKKNGIKENNKTGKLKNINFSFAELKYINYYFILIILLSLSKDIFFLYLLVTACST